MSVLDSIAGEIAEAARRAGPAVVGRGRGWEAGSGFVLARNEVLVAAGGARPGPTAVTFADGRRASAEVTAADADLGVALVAVDTGGVEPLPWALDADGDSQEGPAIGAPVIALASPGGRGLRATHGFVASRAGSFRGPRGRRTGGGIEHTAPLPRGSAGGPLVDQHGRLVGINLVRVSHGIILAVPADAALRGRLAALRSGTSLPARSIGVAVAPSRVARRLRRAVGLPERDGLLIRAIEEGSPGAEAGLAPGDLITEADGREITGVDALHGVLEELGDARQLTLSVLRGTEERSVTVDFGGGREAAR